MAVSLSPWPTSPAAVAASIGYLGPLIGLEGDANRDRVSRLGATAAALVEAYAPTAPLPLKNEAAVRVAGYLAQSDFGGIASEEVGVRRVAYVERHGALFRNSGAEALLTRHKRRRAGSVG